MNLSFSFERAGDVDARPSSSSRDAMGTVKRARRSVDSDARVERDGGGGGDGDDDAREGIEASIHRMSTRFEARAWTSRDARETEDSLNPFVSREAIASTTRAFEREGRRATGRWAEAFGTTPREGERASLLTRAREEGREGGDEERDAFDGCVGRGRSVEVDAEAFERFVDGGLDGAYGAQMSAASVGDAAIDDEVYTEAFRAFCKRVGARRHAWVNANKSVVTNWHYDNYDNVLFVACGAKRVTLRAPVHAPYASTSNGESAGSLLGLETVGTDGSNHVDARYVEDGGTTYPSVRLEAGDALFIPSGWLHTVVSEPYTFAVSHWWKSEFNDTLERSFYRERDPWEELLSRRAADASDAPTTSESTTSTRLDHAAAGKRNSYHFRRALEVAMENELHNFLCDASTTGSSEGRRLARVFAHWTRGAWRKHMEADDFPDDADLVRLLQSAKRAAYGSSEDGGGGNFEEAHFFDVVWRGVTRVVDESAADATDADPLTWRRLFDWMIRRNAQIGPSPSTSPIVAYRLANGEDIVRAVLHNQRMAVAHRARSLIDANLHRHFHVAFAFDQRDFDSTQTAPVE